MYNYLPMSKERNLIQYEIKISKYYKKYVDALCYFSRHESPDGSP